MKVYILVQVVLILAVFHSSAKADTEHSIGPDELRNYIERVDAIVQGKVLCVESRWDTLDHNYHYLSRSRSISISPQRGIYTIYTIDVDTVLAGAIESSVIDIYTEGGNVGQSYSVVGHRPPLPNPRVGAEVIVGIIKNDYSGVKYSFDNRRMFFYLEETWKACSEGNTLHVDDLVSVIHEHSNTLTLKAYCDDSNIVCSGTITWTSDRGVRPRQMRIKVNEVLKGNIEDNTLLIQNKMTPIYKSMLGWNILIFLNLLEKGVYEIAHPWLGYYILEEDNIIGNWRYYKTETYSELRQYCGSLQQH